MGCENAIKCIFVELFIIPCCHVPYIGANHPMGAMTLMITILVSPPLSVSLTVGGQNLKPRFLVFDVQKQLTDSSRRRCTSTIKHTSFMTWKQWGLV